MNNYLIYQNGKPINNQFQNFSEVLDFLDTKFKKREVWKKQYIIRIYKKELSKNKMSVNLNIKLVNIDTGKTLEKNNPNWTVRFSHENHNIGLDKPGAKLAPPRCLVQNSNISEN